jgi:tetratricopeptide (TPR) repeat protein
LASEEEKRKIARQFFTRATQAESKQNWDYAVEMWQNAVKLVPDNQEFRLHLRLAQRQKHGNNGKGTKSMTVRSLRSKAKKASSKEEWAEADNIAEQGLNLNPWDVGLLTEVGRSCFERGFHNMAAINYNWAVEQDKENIDLMKKLAESFEVQAKYKEAIAIWERIHKLDPMDSNARSKVTQLHAETVMDRGGYEDAEDTKSVRQEQKSAYDDFDPGASKSGQPEVGPGMSVEADLKRAIRKSPETVEPYLKLASFYRSNKQLEQAAETLKEGMQVSGDLKVRELYEDVSLDLNRHNYELARAASAADPEDEITKDNVKALKIELMKQEISVLSSRVETYPRDSKLKFELAKRFYQVKQIEKAIPLLQKASADNRISAEVGVLLGKCFIAVKKANLAISSLTKALPAIDTHDQADIFCDTHYLLGQLFEAKKDLAKAEEHYNEVIGLNYEYRDALQRLEKIQGVEGEE